MTLAAAGSVATPGSAEFIAAALILALLSGLILVIMGVLRLGFLGNLLSHPVVSGFITASGIIIATSQLKSILGVSAHGEAMPELVTSLVANLGDVNVPTLIIGVASAAFLFWVRKGLKPLLMRFGLAARPADLTAAGRRWLSEPNGNLYLTLAFRPRLPPARMPTFTLWAGANLCQLIATFTRTTPTVKWPNDLLFHGRKCGGILTEARIDADHIRDLVIGIGLNLAAPAAGWPAELRPVATSLAEQSRTPLDPNRLTAALLGRMLAAYERFVAGDHQAALADLWHRYDALRDREVTLLDGDERITGIARGIDDTGALLVRTTAGRTRRFQAGEVTFARPPVPVSNS
jgi:biotin-[acetyl-CoA-carboxylase] ligase BirA-like protein